jgi:hypothetical protein
VQRHPSDSFSLRVKDDAVNNGDYDFIRFAMPAEKFFNMLALNMLANVRDGKR